MARSEGEQTQPSIIESRTQSQPERMKDGRKRECCPLENPEQHREEPANPRDSLRTMNQPASSIDDKSNSSSEIEVVDTKKARQVTASTEQASRAPEQEAIETPSRPQQGQDSA